MHWGHKVSFVCLDWTTLPDCFVVALFRKKRQEVSFACNLAAHPNIEQHGENWWAKGKKGLHGRNVISGKVPWGEKEKGEG
jgi:hypothetical protein